MREIKFRVWDIARKEWVKNTGNPYVFPFHGKVAMTCAGNSTGYIHDEDYSDEYILEQFTGLKDKHGQEIYEGDIVIILDWSTNPLVVEWDSNHSRFALFQVGKLRQVRSGFGVQSSYRYEKVGNIHENPELLEKRP